MVKQRPKLVDETPACSEGSASIYLTPAPLDPLGVDARITLAIMTDPNWLLATMAQSAGQRLVAIAGGFLVSRVVTSCVTGRSVRDLMPRELRQDL